MYNFLFALGVKVKDRISGYEGIVVSRSQWLTGCNTYGVKSEGLHEGKPIDTQWFDEQNLDLIPEKPSKKDDKKLKRDTGGPTVSVPHPNR